MPKQIDSSTHFLNVDLDIYSRSDLEPLVTALGQRVYALYMGRTRRTYEAHLELSVGIIKSADAAIRAFCALIGALPKTRRELWDAAKTREFNIGVQTGMQPHWWETVISNETVEAAAKLNARIGFAVYAPEAPKKIVRKKRPPAGGKRD